MPVPRRIGIVEDPNDRFITHDGDVVITPPTDETRAIADEAAVDIARFEQEEDDES